MKASALVNTIGLVLGIVGAFLLWQYGLPPPISRRGAIHLIAEQTDDAEKAKADQYDRISRWAFGLLVASFALQLIAQFL